jgi:Family of unknown function (DUF6009)
MSDVRFQAQELLLTGEESIVWKEDIEHKDYVRQLIVVDARSRKRPIPYRGNGRMVGYSVLRDDAKSEETGFKGIRYFHRRVFFLTDWDRDSQPEGTYQTGCPMEAVDPRTVKPGKFGKQTDRASGKC